MTCLSWLSVEVSGDCFIKEAVMVLHEIASLVGHVVADTCNSSTPAVEAGGL